MEYRKKRYSRKTTGTTISLFYEHFQLNKYNFNPPYQRDDNVWDLDQKSFLIDTVMKNFPIPPIFLEQKIDLNGKTTYDVIDGKQRLTTIIEFIDNNIQLPLTFGTDNYGIDILNGKRFDEIKILSNENEVIKDFISDFWGYVINIEYIENPDYKIVDNIFDRLNRGGERLNSQELRKARYYDSIMYQAIEQLRNDKYMSKMLEKLNKNRLEDISFLTELYLFIKLGKVIDGTEVAIDRYFSEFVDEIDETESKLILDKFERIKNIVISFDLDYDKYKINGVSHLYAIWYLAYFIDEGKIVVDSNLINKINKFYEDLRTDQKNKNTIEYHKSMQSASKYKYSRKRRVNALLGYFKIPHNPEGL